MIIDNNPSVEIGYKSPKNALEDYLEIYYESPNESDIKVVEREINGVTLAYALQYSKYFKEWNFLHIRKDSSQKVYPIGISVEGIRVEFDTPGFSGQRLISVANATGKNAPKTNVARSIIENTNEKNILLESIYKLYVDHIKEQINNLNLLEGFSLTWSAHETTYLLLPFLNKKSNEDKSELKSTTLFTNAINDIKAIIIECNKIRQALSAIALQNTKEVLTIDCDLYRSAENILKEVKNNTSLSKILEAVYGQDKVDLDYNKNILCGFDPSNILHQNALKNKEITGIKLHHNIRRVDLIWTNTNGVETWYHPHNKISLIDEKLAFRVRNTLYGRHSSMYIQKGDINIEGVIDEIAVGAFRKRYLLKGSAFHTYISKLINQIEDTNEPHTLFVIEEAISIANGLFYRNDPNVTSDYILEHLKRREEYLKKDGFYLGRIWNGTEKEEIVEAITNTKWKIFDTTFWDRDRSYILDF